MMRKPKRKTENDRKSLMPQGLKEEKLPRI